MVTPETAQVTLRADGTIVAGPFILQPSTPHWRRRKRAYWRALRDGIVLTPWCPTPRLALAKAHLQNR